MKITGKIIGANIDFKSKKPMLMLEVNELNDFKQLVDDMNGQDKLSIEIKPFRQRRSLDANAYSWVLIDKLSVKLGHTKEEIYREQIRQIGGNSDIVCVSNKAVDKVCETWRKNGIGWLAEKMPSKLDNCTNVTLYYGSSTFDTAQMARFIDNIVQDCKALGIETATPAELALLKERWH